MIKLDGAALAQQRLSSLKASFHDQRPRPCLAIVSVGKDPASLIYIKKKQDVAAQVGFQTRHYALAHACSASELHRCLDACSQDPNVHGILLQLPLPKHLSMQEAILHIDPKKDVDALHPMHMGRLVHQQAWIAPCTPQGIITLLDHYALPLAGQRALIFGRSLIVGTPLSLMLTARGATVTVIHRQTPNALDLLKKTDIVVCATGSPDLFPFEALPENSILIDVGIIRAGKSIRGDIIAQNVPPQLKAYTPVPFGIGPMTVLSLMENLATLYWRQQS